MDNRQNRHGCRAIGQKGGHQKQDCRGSRKLSPGKRAERDIEVQGQEKAPEKKGSSSLRLGSQAGKAGGKRVCAPGQKQGRAGNQNARDKRSIHTISPF